MARAVLLVLPLTACAQPDSPPTPTTSSSDLVSSDLVIVPDGRDAEWEHADVDSYDLTESGSVAITHDDRYVYVAVRDDVFGWAHVYVPHGGTVRVLHASAALGTATYGLSADGWRLQEPFEWGVRDTTFSAEAEAERAAFFADHGWVANTNRMGSRRAIEFRIDKDLFDPSAPRLAVLFAEDPEAPHYWPGGLSDATLDPDLIRGAAPERIAFDPRTWAEVALD